MKVLIVEDDPMVSYLHTVLVEKRGICSCPLSFRNGYEAFNFLLKERQEKNDQYYLILLDLNMPVMNGWDFLEALKAHPVADRSEIVVVTSSTDSLDKEKTTKMKMVKAYLEKPLIDFEQVIRLKRKLEEKGI